MGNKDGCSSLGMTGYLIVWLIAHVGKLAEFPLSLSAVRQGRDRKGKLNEVDKREEPY